HPDVLIYDNLVSREYIAENFLGVIMTASPNDNPYARPDLTHDVEIIDWPQYGLKAARCAAVTTNQRVVSWHHWGIPDTWPAINKRPYMRPYGQGYEELYFRFLM